MSVLSNAAQTFNARLEDLEAVVPPKRPAFVSMEDLNATVESLNSVPNETLCSSSQNSQNIPTVNLVYCPLSLPAFSSLFFCFLCLSWPVTVDMNSNFSQNFPCAESRSAVRCLEHQTDESPLSLANIFVAAVVLVIVFFVYLLAKWVLPQHHRKRVVRKVQEELGMPTEIPPVSSLVGPLEGKKPSLSRHTKVGIDKSIKSSFKPKVRIEVDPPEHQPESKYSMEKTPSRHCQFLSRFPT